MLHSCMSSVWLLVAAVATGTRDTNAAETPTLALNSGGRIPVVGLGTYLGWNNYPKDANRLEAALEHAIDLGYRHIDTASVYQVERNVGNAIKKKISDGTVQREDLFVTTKLWVDHNRPHSVEEGFNASLDKLGLEYVDLYLMHFPVALLSNGTYDHVDYLDTWAAIVELQKKGVARSIGVSNFNISQLARLLDNSPVKPSVLQVEVHLSLTQEPLIKFAQAKGIVVTAYCPLGYLPSIRNGSSTPAISVTDPELNAIANKYKKSVMQIALKYLIQRGMAIIPKSINSSRISSNIDLFDFELTPDEVHRLDQYNSNSRIVLPEYWQDHPYYPFEHSGKPTPTFVIPTDG